MNKQARTELWIWPTLNMPLPIEKLTFSQTLYTESKPVTFAKHPL